MSAPDAARRDGDRLSLTDREVDMLAWQFLNSDYASDRYGNWALDRRLDGFLQYRGLTRVADDGDVYGIVLDRVMTFIKGVPGRVLDRQRLETMSRGKH